MAKPLLLVESVYSTTQFPLHAISANEEAARQEAWRVGTGRRSQTDRWSPTTANAAAWIRAACDVARTVDMIALDRGHNLAGVAGVKLQRSPDNAAWTDVITFTIPAAAAVPGDVDGANGATTSEGAWVKRFPAATYRYWRLLIPAMGAGLRPQVVGLWLGKSWEPSGYLDLPYEDDARELIAEEAQTPHGWRGAGTVASVRVGELSMKLGSAAEYGTAQAFTGHFHGRRRPAWILYDCAQAERAVLGVSPPGRLGWRVEQGWSREQAVVRWVEHEPALPR